MDLCELRETSKSFMKIPQYVMALESDSLVI